jgi:hypothetical protein
MTRYICRRCGVELRLCRCAHDPLVLAFRLLCVPEAFGPELEAAVEPIMAELEARDAARRPS